MKKLVMQFLVLSGCLLAITSIGAETAAEPGKNSEKEKETEWYTDFEKAQEQAEKEKLPILVNFSGSDWCIWCQRLESEVFATEEFKSYAGDNLVLFLADFPRQKEQAQPIKEQNQKLAQKYEVRGFPTILLLDSDGELLARTGYKRGGAEPYIEHLKELVEKGK